MLFHIIDDCFAVVRAKGVYRQVKVFARGEKLFAGVGAGFVRLMAGGSTTAPALTWDFITPHPRVSMKGSEPLFTPLPAKVSRIGAAE